MIRIVLFVLLTVFALPLSAENSGTIDLQCEALAKNIVKRLTDEGLLAASEHDHRRALAISREFCSKAQASAEKQHEDTLSETLRKLSLYGSEERKEGNKRLLRMQRR